MQENKVVELEKETVLQIGDTTVIVSSYYSNDNEQNCFDKIAGIIKEEIRKETA